MSPAPTPADPTPEEATLLIAELRRDPLFAKRRQMISLLEQLIDAKLIGKVPTFTRQTVMDCYAAAVTGQRDREHPGAFEAGRRDGSALANERDAGRVRSKELPVPPGMNKAAYRAGVRMGKADFNGKKWTFHPVKTLIRELRETLAKYFDEQHLSTLPADRQPPFIIRIELYEPKFECRFRKDQPARDVLPLFGPFGFKWPTPIPSPPIHSSEDCRYVYYKSGVLLADAFDQATEPSTKRQFLELLSLRLQDDPAFVGEVLADSLAKTGAIEAANHDDWLLREASLRMLGVLVERRRELLNLPSIPKIVEFMAKAFDEFGEDAHKTLGLILAGRPELVRSPIQSTARPPEESSKTVAKAPSSIVGKLKSLVKGARTIRQGLRTDERRGKDQVSASRREEIERLLANHRVVIYPVTYGVSTIQTQHRVLERDTANQRLAELTDLLRQSPESKGPFVKAEPPPCLFDSWPLSPYCPD
jgi:hypothetical protein